MKQAILFVIVALCFCIQDVALAPRQISVSAQDLASDDTLAKFVEALKKLINDGDASGIFNIELNPLLDELLVNVKDALIRNGMDPMDLDDETLQLLGIVGSIKLTNGMLQDTSTVAREGDVVVSYNSNTKRLTFNLPLTFKVLLFTYKYTTRVTLLTISGDVQGKIDDVSMNLVVAFDANTKTFVLDDLSLKNSGKITVKFTGNGLVDWLTNAMTAVITTVLHPLIVAILESNFMVFGEEVVRAFNEYLHANL
ncbi:uncharacterized protein LOC126745391 [Anthonomus grandis grandis]|uniref:uncharacterized protein LOC126745391 n=1 Tax=Anthonomus grandis grandis TaxID=2921223 RepID=UPI002165ECE4|nr:uncharacterized protein LOC126745391 [Anthonomus grandis grandis]